jgi:hypothetical protein
MMNLTNRSILFICFCLLSIFVVYEHASSADAVDLATMIERENKLAAGESEFFNPWQYRILSVWIIESMRGVLGGVLPFLILSFIQNVIIFGLAFAYYKMLGIKNPLLILGGILILAYSFAHSTFASDLSFNTYFDIIFYLTGAWLILTQRYVWIIPLTFVACLNRETCGFIPLMLVVPFVGISKQKWMIAGAALAAYAIAFLSVRFYYGFQPAVGIHGITSPVDYLKFNLTFFKMYPELLGTFMILPVIVLLGFRNLPVVLQRWFWLIVPFWFVLHLAKSTAIETRLFLVPVAIIFVPAFLWLIENYSENRKLPG